MIIKTGLFQTILTIAVAFCVAVIYYIFYNISFYRKISCSSKDPEITRYAEYGLLSSKIVSWITVISIALVMIILLINLNFGHQTRSATPTVATSAELTDMFD